ncbi:MAG: TonB-dependent receptor [Pseudomonadota bacterium]
MTLIHPYFLLAALLGQAGPVELEALAVSGRDLDPGAAEATAELDRAEIETIQPTHPAELFTRLPGTWITRGSGQEHLSAVRSPLLTGAGGCGALLILEDGIPVRPPGFCNVNNLFEVNLLQADSLRVLRGPGGLGHASGGLHGVIDVRSRSPRFNPVNRLNLEAGGEDYRRLGLSLTESVGKGVVGLDANAVDAGSFREDEGYEHQFLNLSHLTPTSWGELETRLNLARLDQDTAGFIFGEDSFRDPVLRRQNLNPEAYRRATAARFLSRASWSSGATENRLTGFARRSRMTFLQHFLPGKPLERNGQVSLGAQFDQQRLGALGGDIDLDWGLDAEWFQGNLSQEQFAPAVGSPFLVATRPVGQHYDYEVDGQRLGGYLALAGDLNADWRWRAGVSADFLRYDYDNFLQPGNLTDSGEACGFGGCLYTRPDDRTDDFFDIAPEVTLSRDLAQGLLWLRLARGLRAPQATELYRLQSGQTVADLDSEVLDAIELGIRSDGRVSWEVVAFAQRKDNFIFRDSEGFNVSDGRTRHVGVEFDTAWAINERLSAGFRGTYAAHTYRFDRDARGEVIVSGRDIRSAPRRLWSADLNWTPTDQLRTQLAVESTGRYYLDAANSRRYGGHTLLHAAADYQIDSQWQVGLRLRNLTGKRYAERADFAFGNFRYFPGAGRLAVVNVSLGW